LDTAGTVLKQLMLNFSVGIVLQLLRHFWDVHGKDKHLGDQIPQIPNFGGMNTFFQPITQQIKT